MNCQIKRSLLNDECTICFEEIDMSNKIVFCLNCHKGIHTKCFKSWIKKNDEQKNVCINCTQKGCLQYKNVSCLDKLKQCFVRIK